ncbi:MAG TPA: hypothetical protein VFA78_01720 [Chloroflexota bacterium]|nr:hypothetical protein [Chloroflexota bacterium]
MIRRWSVIPIAVVVALSVTVTTGRVAPVAAAGCSKAGYSSNNSVCIVVPAHGSFSVKVPGTGTHVKGKGTKGSAGTKITLSKVSAPVPKRGGFGLKVRANHAFGPLKVSPGKTYKYKAGSNTLTQIKSITTSGLYQVVP